MTNTGTSAGPCTFGHAWVFVTDYTCDQSQPTQCCICGAYLGEPHEKPFTQDQEEAPQLPPMQTAQDGVEPEGY